jgi:Ca2+-dependent lipid-binding protein
MVRSQVVKSTLNPDWENEQITIEELCNNDLNTRLLFEIWDWDRVGSHDLIGRFTVRETKGLYCCHTYSPQTSMTKILQGVVEYKIVHPEKQVKKTNYTKSGCFIFSVKSVFQRTQHSFLQFLQCTTIVTI